MKNNTKTITVVLYIVLALFLIFAVLYFCGVFDPKPEPVEDEPVIEETQVPEEDTTEEEKEPQAYVSDAITFDENGVADVGDVHDDPNMGALDDKKPTAEPVSDPKVDEQPVEQTTTQQPAEQTTTEPEQKPEAKPQSSGGTTMYEGVPVRVVDSLNGLTPNKPFETVMVNGVAYGWDGSQWFKKPTEKTPNQSTIIDTSDPSWTEQVGH